MDNVYSDIPSSTLVSNQRKWGVLCIRVEICKYSPEHVNRSACLQAILSHRNYSKKGSVAQRTRLLANALLGRLWSHSEGRVPYNEMKRGSA